MSAHEHPSLVTLVAIVAAWAAVLATAFQALCALRGQRGWARNPTAGRGEDECNVVRALCLLVIALFSVRALLAQPHALPAAADPGSFEATAQLWIHATEDQAWTCTALYIGYIVFDLGTIEFWPRADWEVFLFHHVTSAVVFPIAVYWGYCQTYVLYFLATEISSALLSLYLLLEKHAGKQAVLTKGVGLVFALSFFAWRLLGALYQLGLTAAAPMWSNAPAHAPGWVVALSVTTLAPPALNFYWGKAVLMGIVSAGPPEGNWTAAREEKDK